MLKCFERKGRSCILLLLVLTFILWMFSACQGAVSVNKARDRSELWDEDISFLMKELPKRHKNLFFKIGRDEFEQRLEALKKAVPDMNDTQVILGMKRIVAAMGDAHTDVQFQPAKICPISLYWFGDGIYALNTVAKYKSILYKELVKINGYDAAEVVKAIDGLIANENDMQLKHVAPRYLIAPEILAGLGFAENTDSITYTFRAPDGSEEAVKVAAVQTDKPVSGIIDESQERLPLYRTRANLGYWYEYLENEKLLYFKYNKCADMEGQTVKQISREMLKLIDDGKVDKLVVDLRDNGGGNSSLLDPFIEELSKRDISNKGKVFVIVGRRTFSSAILNAISLKQMTKAVFIGEPTGGRPNHYGEVRSFKLPNSGITVSYSTKYFKHSKEDTDSFYPDITIELSVQDFKEGRDPVMDYIIKH